MSRKIPRREVKRIMVLAMGSCCQVCGYSRCLSALEFHHLDPTKKRFSYSHMVKDELPWSMIVKELRKSVLICGNCHKEFHEGLVRLPEHYARFDERYTHFKFTAGIDGPQHTNNPTATSTKARSRIRSSEE